MSSIEEFNQLSIECQQSIILNHLKNTTSGDEKTNLTKIGNLLGYLNENNEQKGKHLFSIPYQNKEKSLSEIICHINEIELLHQATVVLHSKNGFKSAEFKNHLINFGTVLLEIEYQSSSFEDIYKQSLNLKKIISTGTKIIISIFIHSENGETDMKFRGNKNVEIIKLDQTVTQITGGQIIFRSAENGGSFSRCSLLRQVIIPPSVISIGTAAFNGCSLLTQITIPSSVTSIGSAAFRGCSSITQIIIPSSVTTISNFSFKGCSALIQISIPSSVKSIGDYAFNECKSLTQVSFETPSSVISIGNLAFRGCLALKQISIPPSVKSIGDYGFNECTSLTQVLFENPSSLDSIGNGSFSKCSLLSQIKIPFSVTLIGVDAFEGCSSLARIPNLSQLFIDKIIDSCIQIQTEEGYPKIYKLPQVVTKSNPNKRINKVIVGPQKSTEKDEVKILIAGLKGSGKTTFLNGVANYLYGVQWEDDFRFKVVSEKDGGSTDSVTSYTFYWQTCFPIPYTVTLIEWPGFGDSRGIYFDKRIISQLESLFKNECDCGIDSLNAVVFVIQSSISRMTTVQQYIIDSIMQLFGKDMADNFIIAATFADEGEPQVYGALNYANFPTNYVSKFNNSALFAKNNGPDEKNNKCCWNFGKTSYESIFNYVAKMSQNNLSLTQNVFDQRKNLFISIDTLNKKIREGIEKMSEIEQSCSILERLKHETESCKNFTIEIEKVQITQEQLKNGEHCVNCMNCNRTCHYPCHEIVSGDDLHNCSVMDRNGLCTVCRCHCSAHFFMSYRWKEVKYRERKTLEELKKKYENAVSKKASYDQMIENAKNEYKQIEANISNYLATCKECINSLQKITLKCINLPEIDYIQIQIESETSKHSPGWKDRVEWLKELLQQQKLFEAIYNGKEQDLLPKHL